MSKQVIIAIVLSLLTAGATPAFAQSQPFQGLFGQPEGAAPPQSLDFSTSVYAVDDTNLPRLVARDSTTNSRPDVRYSDLHAGLWFTKRSQHTAFSANGTTAVQYYPQLSNALRWSGASAAALTKTGQRFRLGLDQQMRYSPYAHFRVIPIRDSLSTNLASVSAPDVALAVSGRESYRYNTGINGGYQLSRRTMLDASYQHEILDFVPLGQSDWRTQDGSVSIAHSMTAKTAFLVGYGYHRRDFEGERLPLRRNDLNLGVSYNNTLPFSPRTVFTFNVGSTALSRERSTPAATSDNTFFRMIGRAELDHQLAQAWHVGLFYHRGVQYIEGISDFFLADSVTGNLRGYLGPRIELRATAGYSTGPLRFGPRQRGYDTSGGSARVRMAISRGLAAQAEYVYYRYLFADAVTLPTGIRSRENRHVFRVGLTTWIPLLQ